MEIIIQVLKSSIFLSQIFKSDFLTVTLKNVLHDDTQFHIEVLPKGNFLLQGIVDVQVFTFAIQVKTHKDGLKQISLLFLDFSGNCHKLG